MFFQRLLRATCSNTSRHTFAASIPPTFRPVRTPYLRPIQRRGYRPINYRHFITSWNTLRIWVRNPLFYYNIAGISLLCGIFYYSYLERVPATGRLRFNIVSSHWEEQLAKKLEQEYLDDADYRALPDDSLEHAVARRVFDQIVPNSGLPEAGWHVTVYDDPDQEAFVLPGGSVFISTGMVNFCSTDDEVAAVFGHEMAHHVCHHSAESISRNLIYMPALMISWLVTGMDPDLVEIAVDVAFRLPGSRVQEREADQLGLLIMAQSGYDASACFDLWSRWEEYEKSESPSYLSTHPSHHNRTTSVYAWLSAARNERLRKHTDGDDMRVSYYLQRSFCGLNRGILGTAPRN